METPHPLNTVTPRGPPENPKSSRDVLPNIKNSQTNHHVFRQDSSDTLEHNDLFKMQKEEAGGSVANRRKIMVDTKRFQS